MADTLQQGNARTLLGQQMGELARRAWREVPPALEMDEATLTALVPVVSWAQLNAMVRWKIRKSPLAKSVVGRELRQDYLKQSLSAATATHRVYLFVTALRKAGIEPIVFKGWSLFPYYAEQGLRPAGDVDLAVPPHEGVRALQVLTELGVGKNVVDVHPGLADPDHAAFIPNADWEDLLTRSRVRVVGGAQVRLLSAEDELQVLCIHGMRHLLWRPIWLVDIAAALEHHPKEMDWKRACATPPYASWILYAALLAERLVGANLEGTPFAGRGDELPEWLVQDVLLRWSAPPVKAKVVYDSILSVWREPSRWGDAARVRLPNKLAATLDSYGGLDERFLARYQVRWFWRRLAAFAGRTTVKSAVEEE